MRAKNARRRQVTVRARPEDLTNVAVRVTARRPAGGLANLTPASLPT